MRLGRSLLVVPRAGFNRTDARLAQDVRASGTIFWEFRDCTCDPSLTKRGLGEESELKTIWIYGPDDLTPLRVAM